MTKKEGLRQLRANSRAKFKPEDAKEIALALGYTLANIGIKEELVDELDKAEYKDGKLECLGTVHLAKKLAEAEGITIPTSTMKKKETWAQDITHKITDLLK